MNRNQRAIDITVELLKKHGVRHIVISPGATNLAFVNAVKNDPAFTCYSIVDERSAIYFAIGLYLQTGEIIAASCTSAQATRNYIPGLTEAFYKRVPILAITMEKHVRFIGQEYMQAPHQMSLPDDSVKQSFETPFVSDVNDEYHCIRVVNEAILKTKEKSYGPVQLCIPWLDFPIKDERPEIRKIEQLYECDCKDINLGSKKVLVVIGEHLPFTEEEKKSIESFAEKHNCAIYANHLSNYDGKYVINANLGLTTLSIENFIKDYAPDVIITIGGQTGDYPLYLLISKPELKAEHWRISEDGQIVDTYDKLTKVFCMSEKSFFNAVDNTNSDHSFYEKFNSLCLKMDTNIEVPLSNAYLAQELHTILPKNSIMQFSILNSLRVWNLFDLDPSIQCYSNVGAFGIDGGLSTLIGQSIATDKMSYMIIGDLAFYYDMNSLGIRHIKNNLRVIVINNNGGVEFKLSDGDHAEVDKYTAAANHYKNAKGWAETCGFKYIDVRSKEDLQKNKKLLVEESEQPIVMEIFVSDADDYKGYKNIVDANKKVSMTDKMKKGFGKLVRF
ncbi:thiamine pyrophosphate-binding protein [Pseudobutyrivibrio ruminis]|uniref:thiamine pyrophosphate-binding protein n=1 Tax=Pseudobutyrivibrio ruminis TaxID=46206 RepID=UPI000424724F|nr:thiamine pyrophosphate-binding protein [Pseudobutyrivibrio ruminis]